MQVTREYVNSVVPDKPSLYEACVRNQFWMPPAKDNILTVDFMKGLQAGKYWLPKSIEIRLMNCADPPNKFDLAKILTEVMSAHPSQGEPFDTQFQRTLIEIKAKPPSVSWMLALLSTMDQNHAIFAKNYVKPKPMRNGMR